MFDEISRRNVTEPRSSGDPAMDWRNAEGMYEFWPTGLKPPCQSPACLQNTKIMERAVSEQSCRGCASVFTLLE